MTHDLRNGPVKYAVTAKRNPIEKLRQRLAQGDLLAWDAQYGYLPAVLEALQVPLASQVLVYSKTSFQAPLIMPANPRAIYFNDDVYVGWVRGGDFVEMSVADPDLGAVFYVLEQERGKLPSITRQDDCLQCHHAGRTAGVPGHLVRSVVTHRNGMVDTTEPSHVTDHRTPFEERFGGWYVSGSWPKTKHRGNVLVPQLARFSIDAWPAAHSDVVALMVLEHQTMGHNYLARLNYETRAALDMHRALLKMDKKATGPWSESTTRRIDYALDAAIRYLTFADEAPWPGPISGDSAFTTEYQRRGALYRLNLETRLYEYPLSPLVHSEALTALEPQIQTRFWERLKTALHSEPLAAKGGREAWAALRPRK
ncbi:MAG: hypothetical protein OHK0021_15440 [Bryobacter sp.]